MSLRVAGVALRLRAGDRAELRGRLHSVKQGSSGDVDGHGVPDSLDSLIGAYKAALNGGSYD